jgi:outer membrane protein TolC
MPLYLKESIMLRLQFALLTLSLFQFISPGVSQTETNRSIDLPTVLQLAGADNLHIKEFELRHQLALAEYSKSKEWVFPTLSAGVATHYLNGAAMNTEGPISSDVQRDNLSAGIGASAEWNFGEGIFQKQAAQQRAEATAHQIKAQKNQIILSAVDAYYDLLIQQVKQGVFEKMISESERMTQQIEVQVDAGLRYKSEQLLAQANYNHLKVTSLQAKAAMLKASAKLRSILNLTESVELIASDTALAPIKMVDDFSTIDITTTFQNRSEYFGFQGAITALQTEKKRVTKGLAFPTLRIGIYDAAFGKISTPLFNTFEINAGLIWDIPLGKWIQKGDRQIYDARVVILENQIAQFENQVSHEIQAARSQINTADEQMILANEALDFASQALQQGLQRQQLGTIRPFEVFQSQEFYMQAQMDYIEAVTNHNKAQYSLYVALGNDL